MNSQKNFDFFQKSNLNQPNRPFELIKSALFQFFVFVAHTFLISIIGKNAKIVFGRFCDERAWCPSLPRASKEQYQPNFSLGSLAAKNDLCIRLGSLTGFEPATNRFTGDRSAIELQGPFLGLVCEDQTLRKRDES